MKNHTYKSAARIAVVFVCLSMLSACTSSAGPATEADVPQEPQVTQGTLRAVDDDGDVVLEFPLRHTAVYTQISGFLAQVEVRQHFYNPHQEKIEAVYVFPLPENSAVNEMIMVVGQRNIYGEIHKRRIARQIYEDARAAGKRTALLEQERPNIFTQSVANIQPGEEIVITIRYVQTLKYDRGLYRYVFPMVVGPRFIPGAPTGKLGPGWANDTNDVPDASRITPPVLKPGRRSGHDISLNVTIDAGMAMADLNSISHDIDVADEAPGRATVGITPADTIPNKDFVLAYRLAAGDLKSAYLTHCSQQGAYLMLMLQPSLQSVTENIEPKEIFFVIDCSGSMSGYPIQKVKEAMYHCIQGISPDDTFQIIRFSSKASAFAPEPVPATRVHKDEALDYIQALHGSGGTMMIEGIKACLDYPRHPDRQRIVFFMTDGFIGNDDQILAAIKEKVGPTRLFSFGVGSSPNRSLLERMAQLGRGTAQYIRQDQPAAPVITDMLSRISKPYLTDVEIDWAGLGVVDVYPNPIPDLYSAQPLIIFARYEYAGAATITLKGKINGRNFSETMRLSLTSWNPQNPCLAHVWAREKIKYLMLERLAGRAPAIAEQVTNLALDYNLMSQYTSFVAVDEVIPDGADTTLPRTIAIPVPMPEGVSFTGVFGPPEMYPGDAVRGLSDGMSLAAKNKGGLPYPMRGSAPPQLGRALAAPSLRAPMANAPRSGLTTMYYGRATARKEDAFGIGLADIAGDKYLQDGFGELAERDKPLYNTITQIYYGRRPDEKTTARTIDKLLTSDNDADVTVGLYVLASLARQKAEIDEKFVADAEKLAVEGADPHVRNQALWALHAVEQPLPLAILEKAARDPNAAVRMFAAYALAGEKLPAAAEPIIARLVNDTDHRVAALAIKAATDSRKMNTLIAPLSNILLKADPNENYLAVLEAALGLSRLAGADPNLRTQTQKIFVKTLAADYPASVGPAKSNLKKAVAVVALKNLAGYDQKDAYQALMKLAADPENDVRTLAVSVLAGYEQAAPYLAANVLADESFLDEPELLTEVVQRLREYHPKDDFYDAARKMLENKKTSARTHGTLRVALVEALFDRAGAADIDYLASLLRKDPYWKVRRTILAALAGLQKENVLDTAVLTLEDPHPVIKQLAFAEAVAATAEKGKRLAYLRRLARKPTPAVCDEILAAEGLSADSSVCPPQKLKSLVAARTTEIP